MTNMMDILCDIIENDALCDNRSDSSNGTALNDNNSHNIVINDDSSDILQKNFKILYFLQYTESDEAIKETLSVLQ